MPGVGICALLLWGQKEGGLQVLAARFWLVLRCCAGYPPALDVGALA